MMEQIKPAGASLNDQLGLVERLRSGCTDWDGSQMAGETPPMDCLTAGDVREAADEIERQRADYTALLHAYHQACVDAANRAEDIERLRAALDDAYRRGFIDGQLEMRDRA